MTELDEAWYTVVKQGVRGYVLADRVKQLQPAHEGIELPEAYQPLPDFKAVYSATADVNLSIRKEKDENAKLLGTVYENESVDVMDFDEKWAHVKKDNAEGYVRAVICVISADMIHTGHMCRAWCFIPMRRWRRKRPKS